VGGERDIEVSEAKMMQLYEGFKVANRVVPAPDALPFMRDMGQFFRQALFRPAQDVLLDIGKGLGALAKDLNKEKPLLRIEASDLLLTHAGEILLRRVFVHLLRNTMDHGIETASERIAKGKPAAGTISVMLSEDAMGMTLRYQDDGRGLNLEKIRALAAERNAVPHAERLTQEEVGELIFCPGLSTASEVSDISGRGVGMSAVRSYLQNWGGSITVHLTGQEHLEPGFCSFQFDIKLPQSLFAGAEKPDSAVAA
jgi:signal transduction histidine kinase